MRRYTLIQQCHESLSCTVYLYNNKINGNLKDFAAVTRIPCPVNRYPCKEIAVWIAVMVAVKSKSRGLCGFLAFHRNRTFSPLGGRLLIQGCVFSEFIKDLFAVFVETVVRHAGCSVSIRAKFLGEELGQGHGVSEWIAIFPGHHHPCPAIKRVGGWSAAPFR